MSEDVATWVAGWKIDASRYGPDTLVVAHDGECIDLLKPAQFDHLPNGTLLISIFGEERVKGRDAIDTDTRAGYMAFGVPCPRGVGDWSTRVHADD